MPQLSSLKLNPEKLKNAVAAVVGRAIATIKRFSTALHNRCNLVVFIDASGLTCSTFLRRDAFTGYHFDFSGDKCFVTNKETGDVYTVAFDRCSCPAFKYSPKHECKHQLMVAQLRGEVGIEQVIAQVEFNQHIEEQAEAVAPEIDPLDVPIGCLLKRTDDWMCIEYEVWGWGYKNERGIPRIIQKHLGRIVQHTDGIYTYRVTSGIARTFQTTKDAISYLVRVVGTSFEEIAAAFAQREEFKKRLERM
jgi:hypothetical protein